MGEYRKYDIIVVGGGPGGYRAAELAINEGMSVALIEEGTIGGVCLNSGCIPAKTLLYCSHIVAKVKGHKFAGIRNSESIEISVEDIIQKKDAIIHSLRKALTSRLTNAGINLLHAKVEKIEKSEELFTVYTDNFDKLNGRNVILATGAKEQIPSIQGITEGLKSGFVLTSEEFFNQKYWGERNLIVGAGITGIEFADFICSIGKQATLIENETTLLPQLDVEISTQYRKALLRKGIDIKLGITIHKIQPDKKNVLYSDGQNCYEEIFDNIVLCTGRTPQINRFGLDQLQINPSGQIISNQFMQTNIKGLFVIGDASGKKMLAHAAYLDAKIVIEYLSKGKITKSHKNNIPYVIYTSPELAWTGMTEKECIEFSIPYFKKNCSMNYSSKFVIEHPQQASICKMLFSAKEKTCIGACILGDGASEIISNAVLMIEHRTTLDDIKQQSFPHPTIGEIFSELVLL